MHSEDSKSAFVIVYMFVNFVGILFSAVRTKGVAEVVEIVAPSKGMLTLDNDDIQRHDEETFN